MESFVSFLNPVEKFIEAAMESSSSCKWKERYSKVSDNVSVL